MSYPSRVPFLLVLIALFFAGGGFAAAQSFPVKPIRLIVPQAPGGGADFLARTIALALTERWSQQVVVDNRTGGGTIIATELTARSAPDGYTLMIANIALAVNPALHAKLPYDAGRDLLPITQIVNLPTVLAVHASLPVASISELVALGRKKPSGLTFGSSGAGSNGHIAGEMFGIASGGKLVHVPHKGGGLAALDVIGGRIEIAFISVASATPHVQTGKLKALALTDSKRSSLSPHIPTIAETLSGVEVNNWLGLVGPAGMSANLVNRINNDVIEVTRMQQVRDRLASQGFDLQTGTAAEFARLIRSETARYAKVVRAADIRLN